MSKARRDVFGFEWKNLAGVLIVRGEINHEAVALHRQAPERRARRELAPLAQAQASLQAAQHRQRAEQIGEGSAAGTTDKTKPAAEMYLGPSAGVGTIFNFQPLGAGKAAITGDFALLGSEVASVAATLRSKGVEVTAVHSHMTDDQPHLFYMHFFANDDALQLARGLRAALDLTNSQAAAGSPPGSQKGASS